MSVEAMIAAGRRSAEALMTARCKITRIKPVSLDTGTLLLSDTDPSDDLVLESPCRLKAGLARVESGDFEGQLLAGQQIMLHLPVLTSGVVKVGDTVEILEAPDDPSTVGVKVRVQGLAPATQATARRLPVSLINETAST